MQRPQKQTSVGRGISFAPDLWARVVAESEQMERPNRSLVVERALRLYFGMTGAHAGRMHEEQEEQR